MFEIYRVMWNRRKMVHALSIQEIKKEYAGTLLGFLWGLVNPLMRIAVFWFVFSIGARAGGPINGAPYMAWLAVGLVAWFFINDSLRLSKNSFQSKRGIIRNTPFPITILPTVQILFSFYIHLILLLVVGVVIAFSVGNVSLYWFQIIYYDIASIMILIGLGSVTAPLVAVSKDLGRFLDTVLIFLFWMTPIFWSSENLGRYEVLVKINPFHYIVQGYRESIFYNVGFWEHPVETIYFWIFVLLMLILGNYLFKKLKPIFLDIL